MDAAIAPLTSPLVSVDWLQQTQEHHPAGVVVVDCRFALADPALGRSQYAQAHIPGAHYLHLNDDLSGPVLTGGKRGRHPLPEAEVFQAKLRALGIGPETRVVAYDDSRFAFAARFWWLLRSLGHCSVAVLDGGWAAWVAAGLPTSSVLPELVHLPVHPALLPTDAAVPGFAHWVTIEQVKNRDSAVMLVDSRSPERYRGEVEPIDPIAGHIPGAVNAFWQGVTNDQGFALNREAQRDRWRQVDPALGSADRPMMVYCGSGVTACVNLLSLELAGMASAQLYAGSWSDWCAYEVTDRQK